jgi:cytochrome c oxidase subunit 2
MRRTTGARPIHWQCLRSARGLLAALLAVAPIAAGAADSGPAEEVVLAPEPLRYCVTCHGVELQGNQLVDAPRLAGLPHWYVERQLQAFRAGWRGTHAGDVNGMEMHPQATVLTDAEVARAADYAASVPVRSPPPVTVAGDAARGQALYAPCAACHGTQGEGNESLSGPPLAGQSDWYLVTQLNNFRSGARGSAPGDSHGATMAASVGLLTDDAAVNDVVAYVNTLEPARNEPSQKESR